MPSPAGLKACATAVEPRPVAAHAIAATIQAARGPLSRDPADAMARIAIAGLFLGLAWRIGGNFFETGRPTGLLLLTSELLVVVLTVTRRYTPVVDRRAWVRIVAAMSLIGPLLLRPARAGWLVAEALTATVSAAGLAVVIAGKLSLGRSFGLLPANRGIVCTGVYRIIRHPIYVGYLVTHLAFLAAHPTMWNAAALLSADMALVLRARLEEQTLGHDPAYAEYRRVVRWRLLPGLY